MGMEIERKYLVHNDDWRALGIPMHYVQGYLVSDGERTVRVRVAGANGFITIKGQSQGISRLEFEYLIPREEALEMLQLSAIPLIEKYRTKVRYEGKIWEIDEFEGENKGLIMAEIELKSEDETFSVPDWIGQEVTGDIRYYNSSLARNPYKNW
ncbi:MAG: CYTH domain-containing protein [Bacteroidia bacterium]|nr:CYTH domain-containing protein [Bacteroidia bacterium]